MEKLLRNKLLVAFLTETDTNSELWEKMIWGGFDNIMSLLKNKTNEEIQLLISMLPKNK